MPIMLAARAGILPCSKFIAAAMTQQPITTTIDPIIIEEFLIVGPLINRAHSCMLAALASEAHQTSTHARMQSY
jgi:hypothetical protein